MTKEKLSAKGSRPYDENLALLKAYRAGDNDAGERLATLNAPLVLKIAARFRDRGAEMSDLVEVGTLGLCKAIRTFEFERECAFSTYAVPLIFGEIRRFLRDDGIIKVSREEKRLCALLLAEKERRISRGESADISTLAGAVGVSVQDAASAIFSATPVRSLDECAYDDDDPTTLGSTVCDEDAEIREFDRFALRAAIEGLPEMQRRLIILRYFRDLSQVEVARRMGITQVKVSREEKKILALLREKLE